jgi:hypothetical protein
MQTLSFIVPRRWNNILVEGMEKLSLWNIDSGGVALKNYIFQLENRA